MERLLKEALMTIGLLDARLKCNQHLKLDEEKDVRAIMNDLNKALKEMQEQDAEIVF